MKFRLSLLSAGLIFTMLFAGCGDKEEKKAPETPVQTAEEQPSELEMKFEKFRDSYGRANGLYESGDYENAETAYLEALEIAPGNISALYNLACTYALHGKQKEALVTLRKAVEGGWWNNAHLDRDTDLESIRNTDGFKEIYNLTPVLENSFRQKWNSVYGNSTAKGKSFVNLQELKNHYKTKQEELYNGSFLMSDVAYREKNYAIMQEMLASLKMMDWEHNPDVYFEVLTLYYFGNEGDREESAKLYGNFIRNYEGDAVAKAMYGYARANMDKLKNPDEAQKTIDELTAKYPESRWAAMAYADQALNLYYSGDEDKAYQTYLKAVDSAGSDKDASAYLKENLWFYEYNRVGLPSFEASDWDGKPFLLDEYKGKVLMMDFWATWCGPCVAEIPNVVKAYQDYNGKGFEIVGISLDQGMTADALRTWCSDKKMPWRQIYDGKGWEASLAKTFNIRAIPSMLIIDREGKVHEARRGEALVAQISELVGK